MARTIRRGLLGVSLAIATGAVAAGGTGSATAQGASGTEPLPQGLVAPVGARLLRGLGPGDVLGGELQIVYRSDGATLSVESLRLDPDLVPAKRIQSRRPDPLDGCFLVSPFDRAGSNRLGGGFATYVRAPGTASASLQSHGDGTDRRALHFTFSRPAGTWAGLTIDLFDETSDTVSYLDARGYDALVFRVREPAPAATVKIADAAWRARGEARELGPLAGYLGPDGTGDGTGWRWARLRLAALPGDVDPAQLARLVLQAGAESGSLAIDDLMLCAGDADLDRAAALPPAPTDRRLTRALWVWSTRELAATPGDLARLVQLLVDTGIDRAYLQLPGAFMDPAPFAPGDVEGLRPLLRALHAAGVASYGLDGAPGFAEPGLHDRVVESVRRVAAFNAAGDADASFAGVHLDVEPYLLDAWDGAERAALVADYLHLLERVHEATAAAGLPLEAAIPFWFDGLAASRSLAAGAGFRPLSDAVIDRVDTVVIMDYRTAAEGGNGVLALAESELEYASRTGRSLLVALETGPLPDAELLRFRGRGSPGHPPAEGTWIVLAGGAQARVAVVVDGAWPPGMDPRADPTFHWPVGQRILQPSDRQTFHGSDAAALEGVLQQAAQAFARYPAFAGFAVHHYDTYRRLLER